jgi:hypothetical protein
MISSEFGVSEHTMRKGEALQKTCDILPEDENERDQPLFDAVIQKVIQFCENDE